VPEVRQLRDTHLVVPEVRQLCDERLQVARQGDAGELRHGVAHEGVALGRDADGLGLLELGRGLGGGATEGRGELVSRTRGKDGLWEIWPARGPIASRPFDVPKSAPRLVEGEFRPLQS